MKSRLVLLSSLLLAMLLPFMVMGSSACDRGTSTPKNEVWTRQFGANGMDAINAMVVDASANIYVSGDAGRKVGPLYESNAFITKYDTSGNVVWSIQLGTTHTHLVGPMLADGSGNIYVAGTTGDNLGGQTSSGTEPFIARYDTSGNEVWIRQFGTGDAADMAADASGNIYVAGATSGGQDGDIFVAKYDTSGNQVWITQFGTANYDSLEAIIADGLGSIYMAGTTLGTFSGQTSSGPGHFIAKYDTSGNEVWIRQFGTIGTELNRVGASDGSGKIMVADECGNIYVAGTTSDDPSSYRSFIAKYDGSGSEVWTKDFTTNEIRFVLDTNPDGSGDMYVAGATSEGDGGDAFIGRYDTSGNELWTTQFGRSEIHSVGAMVLDGSAYIYVAGPRGFLGSDDAFIAKCDTSGDEVWTRQFGTTDYDSAYLIVMDGAGNVYVAGRTNGAFPGQTSSGDTDVFITKIRS